MLNRRGEWMRAPEHTPRGPFSLLHRRHGLAEIVERGAAVPAEHRRVDHLHPDRDFMTLTENAPRCGYRFAQQRPGFFEAF